MGLRKKAVYGVLAMACAPVAGLAQTVLFSDDFDAGTSQSRYTFFSADREGAGTFGSGTFVGDTAANFNFSYGGYTYRYTDIDGFTPLTATIPSAPNSVGATTVGVRFDVNQINGGTALIQALPKLSEYAGGVAPSGDHKLKADVWVNYNGGSLGGGGSTEWMLMGVNQDGINPAGGSVGGTFFGTGQGLSVAVNGERGNSIDYRMYRANTRLDTLNAPATGYVAQTDTFSNPPSTWGSADARNYFYQNLMPFPGAESDGAIGKQWRQIEMSYVDGIVYFTIDGFLVSARSDASAVAGQDMIGYTDFNNTSAAADDVTLVDANFAIFDNVVVTQVGQTRPTWSFNGNGVWSDGAKWTIGVPDGGNTTADFTGAITGPAVITVDGTKTARSLVFDNANSYTLSGGTVVLSAFTQADVDGNAGLDTVLLSGINGTLISRSGSHVIGSNIVMNTPMVATVNPGSTLTHTGDLITNNRNVTKAGGGDLVVKNVRIAGVSSTTLGALTVNGGALRIAADGTDAGVSNVSTLTIAGATDAWTAKVDLNNNSLVVDYATTSTLPTVLNQIKQGYNNGNWGGNGIDSTSAATAAATPSKTALGYGEASIIVGPTGGIWKGQTVDGTAVLVTYTLFGDATLDKTVDSVDFNVLAASFSLSGKQWLDGDFNYDGVVDSIDFNQLASNFAQVLAGDAPDSLGAVVPEPGAIALLTFGAALLRRRRR